jgi:ATP-dependent DNA ligase
MPKRSQTRFVAPTLKGAKPLGVMPGFIEPELAMLRAHILPGGEWVHEIKFDGYRVPAACQARSKGLGALRNQYAANVAVGSRATEPSRTKIC